MRGCGHHATAIAREPEFAGLPGAFDADYPQQNIATGAAI
jgi:hypothetical protein